MIICIIVPGSFPMLAWWPSWWMTTPCSRWSSSSFSFPPPLCFVGEQFYMYWISLLPTVVFMCPALASFTVSDSQHQGLMELPKVASMSVLITLSLSLHTVCITWWTWAVCISAQRIELFSLHLSIFQDSGTIHMTDCIIGLQLLSLSLISVILKCKPPYMQQERIRTGD